MTEHNGPDSPNNTDNTDNTGNTDSTAGNGAERDEKLGNAMDLVKTPFYAWIGAGVRTVEILGDIGARVRAEEEARDGSADSLDDADTDGAAADADSRQTAGIADGVAGRVRDARRKVRDLGDNAGEQSREAFLKALDAAQLAFNDALTKAQAGGDRAFASAHTLPEDVAAGAEQLKPEQLRAVADGYLEAASKIYRELAARGEQAVDEGVHVAKERGSSFGVAGFPGAREDAAADEAKGRGRATDPVSAIFGKLPFAGAAAERVTGSLEDVARETGRPARRGRGDRRRRRGRRRCRRRRRRARRGRRRGRRSRRVGERRRRRRGRADRRRLRRRGGSGHRGRRGRRRGRAAFLRRVRR